MSSGLDRVHERLDEIRTAQAEHGERLARIEESSKHIKIPEQPCRFHKELEEKVNRHFESHEEATAKAEENRQRWIDRLMPFVLQHGPSIAFLALMYFLSKAQ